MSHVLAFKIITQERERLSSPLAPARVHCNVKKKLPWKFQVPYTKHFTSKCVPRMNEHLLNALAQNLSGGLGPNLFVASPVTAKDKHGCRFRCTSFALFYFIFLILFLLTWQTL